MARPKNPKHERNTPIPEPPAPAEKTIDKYAIDSAPHLPILLGMQEERRTQTRSCDCLPGLGGP